LVMGKISYEDKMRIQTFHETGFSGLGYCSEIKQAYNILCAK